MARRIPRAAFLLAVLPAISLGQNAAKPGVVDGSVVNGLTGEPIPHARVTLSVPAYRRPAGPLKGYGAITGEDGKFSWDSVEPDAYDLVVEMRGFIESEVRSELTISPGNATHVKLKLVPEAILTGRVLDSHGGPVEGVKVALLIGAANFKNATTDDRGEFRFTGLPAGKYLLRAAPLDVRGPAEIRTDGTKEECYAPTWFPNALARNEAAPVEATAGAQIEGIEIRMARIPIVRVSGTVTGVIQHQLGVVASAGDGSNSGFSEVRDGKFAIWRLPPGKYQLTAQGRTPDGVQSGSYPISLDVGQSNIDNLTLDVVPEFEVVGQVEWDGAPPPSDRLKTAAIIVQYQYQQYEGTVAADGGFRISHVTAGKQHVELRGMPASVFLKSIRLGPDEMPGRELDLRSDPKGARVTLLLSTAGAEISGVVKSGDVPTPHAFVCLSPDGEPAKCERSARSGADGAFTIRGLAPGRYKLYVAGDLDQPGANPAEVIELHEGDKTTRDLTVVAPVR